MATGKSLRIAWLGPGPAEGGGVAGALTELLSGLADRGHRIDCFLPGAKRPLPERLAASASLTFVWGTSRWRWDRWYSRTRIGAFVSGLIARATASARLRREIVRRHRREPYDLIYQFSTIDNLALPPRLAREIPLVIHPETHAAGELRFLIAERRLSRRCQPWPGFVAVSAIMAARALAQRAMIRRASLLVCISEVFRDHLVRDYGFSPERTVVVPNPVRLERFRVSARPPGEPLRVLVLGRIAARKGIEDVVALAQALAARGAGGRGSMAHGAARRGVDGRARVRVVGGPSLWSDYTPLLADLPARSAEYAGAVTAEEVPGELAASDVLLQASRYEPFALTVAEALAAGVPVIGTSEVGAIERVDRSVAARVAPGDVQAMVAAIAALGERLCAAPAETRSRARAEAERLFAPAVVCAQLDGALRDLLGVDGGAYRSSAGQPEPPALISA